MRDLLMNTVSRKRFGVELEDTLGFLGVGHHIGQTRP